MMMFLLFLVALSVHINIADAFLFPTLAFRDTRVRSRTDNEDTVLTDWVVENLESSQNITSSSTVKAGENDTLPTTGLPIGTFRILAAEAPTSDDDGLMEIRLLLGSSGWGTGVHPTTRLCLEWISNIPEGSTVLDYGCGSGILSIAALHTGASKVVLVDVEAEALVTASRNLALNGFEDRFEGYHTREIVPYCLADNASGGVDVCLANILIV